MEEDSKVYLFKSLAFNLGKGKFDTKGCGITGLEDPVIDEDSVNMRYLKKQIEPILSIIKKIKETQNQMKNDIIDVEQALSNNKTEVKALSNEKQESINNPSIINELSKFKNTSLKEIVYEIVAKRSSSGSFSIPKRLIDSILDKGGLTSINLYSSIELLHIATKILFLNNHNREIHNQEHKNKKHLKEPIIVSIKNKNENINNSNDSSNDNSKDIYSFKTTSIRSFIDIEENVELDYKFLERVVIEPEDLTRCFVTSNKEKNNYPNVREINDSVENINLTVIFLIRLKYDIKQKL